MWSNLMFQAHPTCFCYRLSTRQNCSCGTCSGLVTWRKRCTTDALSGTRHVVLPPMPPLIVIAVVWLNGGVNPMTPVSYMTRASVQNLAHFPQLSLPALSYPPIIPSPCALGQQVITSCMPCVCSLLFSIVSCPYSPDCG